MRYELPSSTGGTLRPVVRDVPQIRNTTIRNGGWALASAPSRPRRRVPWGLVAVVVVAVVVAALAWFLLP